METPLRLSDDFPFTTNVQLPRPDHPSGASGAYSCRAVSGGHSSIFRFKSSSMETSSRHIVTLALASCALQLIHLTPRPAVFSFDNLAIPNGVHSLVVDAPRFFHSIECGIFFQHYTRPRCCCTCTGCAGSPGCVPVLGQPHCAVPSSAAISLVSRRNTVISPSSTISLVQ
jgi:hypothetical protein